MIVAIHRSERVRKGGGFEQVETFVGRVLGRVYEEATGRGSSVEQITEPGIVHVEPRFGFICETEMSEVDPATGDALDPEVRIPTDIRAGAHVEDTFDHPTRGHFKISAILPREDEGVLWGLAATVELVKDR